MAGEDESPARGRRHAHVDARLACCIPCSERTRTYTKACVIAESTFMATSVYRPSHVAKSNTYKVTSATRVARIMTSSFYHLLKMRTRNLVYSVC